MRKQVKPSDYSTAKLVWEGLSLEDRQQAERYFGRRQRSKWYKHAGRALGLTVDQSWAAYYLWQDGELGLANISGTAPKKTSKPSEEEPIEDIIERAQARFRRKFAAKSAAKNHTIDLEDNLPICLAVAGDPHVDADGCDWPELLRYVDVVRDVPGMRGLHVGDITNNWVGRLERLYKEQETTEHNSFRLSTWLMEQCPWDLVQLGNHDLWNRGGVLYKALWSDAQIRHLAKFEANLTYRWPNGEEMGVCVRHNFKGRSMWHPLHGPLKRAQMRPGAALYVQGHLHSGAYMKAQSAIDSQCYIAATVRGFKKVDSYAEEGDFPQEENYEAMYFILDPMAAPTERIRVYGDPDEAAYQLTDIRRRRAQEG